ncbi:MAG: DJ-1/PfpI family protein, partial [Nitrososphaerota archaeon]|nr:DJ-1/PfpI family protein [Nitrososphaerota archaeon]
CHSPLILAKAGLIDGEKITGHPSIAEELSKYNVELAKDPVINSKHVISGKNHYQMHIFLPHFLAR